MNRPNYLHHNNYYKQQYYYNASKRSNYKFLEIGKFEPLRNYSIEEICLQLEKNKNDKA